MNPFFTLISISNVIEITSSVFNLYKGLIYVHMCILM